MTCRDYRPDHNGECLNCDEWYEAHLSAEELQLHDQIAKLRVQLTLARAALLQAIEALESDDTKTQLLAIAALHEQFDRLTDA